MTNKDELNSIMFTMPHLTLMNQRYYIDWKKTLIRTHILLFQLPESTLQDKESFNGV